MPKHSQTKPNMCDPKNTRRYEIYEGCGHRLPKKACDYYCYAYHQCWGAPDNAKDVKVYQWKAGDYYTGLCRFCEEDKDLEGAYKYGKGWEGRERYR